MDKDKNFTLRRLDCVFPFCLKWCLYHRAIIKKMSQGFIFPFLSFQIMSLFDFWQIYHMAVFQLSLFSIIEINFTSWCQITSYQQTWEMENMLLKSQFTYNLPKFWRYIEKHVIKESIYLHSPKILAIHQHVMVHKWRVRIKSHSTPQIPPSTFKVLCKCMLRKKFLIQNC